MGYTPEKKPCSVYGIVERSVIEIQRFCHVLFAPCWRWPYISFEKIIVQIGDCIWKTLFAHYALGDGGFMQSLSFFNILNGDLYLNALIIRLFQIYLGMGQTLREGTL